MIERVMQILQIGAQNPLIVGSFAKTIVWPSGIDLLQRVEFKGTPDGTAIAFSEALSAAMRELQRVPALRIVELKLGEQSDGEPIRWSAAEFLNAPIEQLASMCHGFR